TCGRCKIKHISGNMPKITEDEKRLLSEEVSSGIRLACFIHPESDIQIDIIDQEKNHKVLTKGYITEFNLSPSIWKKTIEIDKPTLDNPVTYEELFKRELNEDFLDFNILKNIKMKSGIFTAVYDEDKFIGLEQGDTIEEIYGVAVDIGTTTVITSLVDLTTGE